MFASSNVLITGGAFTHVDNRLPAVSGGFSLLQGAAVPGAFHNSGERFDPPKCHQNTRIAVIKRIMDWINQLDPDTLQAVIKWLYGPAGAGKSAIAQTIAERCHDQNKLLASFFFSRGDPLRGTVQGLVATLAYQLCLNLPHQVRENIASTIDHDPLIFSRSLEAQFTSLVIYPVKRLAESGFFNNRDAPRLIIIDGLDECYDSRIQCNILHVLSRSIHLYRLPLLFLIASRPEHDISSFFDSPSTIPFLARLALDGDYHSLNDVRTFFKDSFDEIKRKHPLKNIICSSWPPVESVNTLVEKSSGQFIYASTIVKFVSSVHHRPIDRLNIILGTGFVPDDTPFAELDALYTQILSRVVDLVRVQQIIGLLILPCNPRHYWSVPYGHRMEHFLPFDVEDIPMVLSDIVSLISLPSETYQLPRLLHASLGDFFLDQCRSKELYINPAERHQEYALCFYRKVGDIMHYPVDIETAVFFDLFIHCSHASMTLELQQNILKLSIMTLILKSHTNRYITELVPTFFSFLESLEWDTDGKFYRDQLELLDKIWVRHLDTYFSAPYLLSLLAAAQNIDYNNAKSRSSFTIPEVFETQDNGLLCLRDLVCGPNALMHWDTVPKYRKMLIDFFDDPVRSKQYFLDGSKYTIVAKYALNYLCNHWSHPLPRFRSNHDQHLRRCAPRKWLERWGRRGVLTQVTTRHKCLPNTHMGYFHPHPYGPDTGEVPKRIHFNVSKYSWQKGHDAKSVFRFLLFNLPYFLKRSESSMELFHLCSQVQFGKRAEHYPNRARLAKKAIAGYLARVMDETSR